MKNVLPKFLLGKFRDLDHNLKFYNIYKDCLKCHKYNYSSQSFRLNLKNNCIDGSPAVRSEYLGLAQKNEDGYKLFRIVNAFDKNETYIEYARGITTGALSTIFEENEEPDFSSMTLPLLPFLSEEKMIERLNKLILFS